MIYPQISSASLVFIKRMKNVFLLSDKIFHLTSTYKRDNDNRNFVFQALMDIIATKNLEDIDENKRNIFLNKLLRLRNNLSHEEIKDHVLAIGAAAFDALAFTSAYCVLFLAMHQNIQEKVLDEINENGLGQNEEFSMENLSKLKYLDLVIKETMRLLPGVHGIGREAMKDITLSDSIKISRGTIILINIFMLHRRKDLWGDNANKFDPDRFLPENLKDQSKFYIPFSAGKRNCIGERFAIAALKILFVKLLREFKFSTKLRFEDFNLERRIAVKLLNGHLVSIEKRK